MAVEFWQLKSLADGVYQQIAIGFQNMHLSGNLVKTMFRADDEAEGMARIMIPAVRYDIWKYIEEHVFVQTPQKGSYANELELHGSFAFLAKKSKKHMGGHHQGYIDDAVKKALPLWLENNNFELISIRYSSHMTDLDAYAETNLTVGERFFMY